MRFNTATLYLLLVSIVFAPSTILADQKSQKEKQLQALQSEISKLKKVIDVKQDSKSRFAVQLRKIEGQIGELSKKIGSTKKQIKQSRAELEDLRRSRKSHQKKLVQENDILAQQVHAAYTLGKQEKIKLLFSQKGPAELQRNLVFYQYFSNARVNLINEVELSIEKILNTESKISSEKEKLDNSYRLLKQQKTKLDEDSKERKSIISSLSSQIKKQGGQLNQLQDEAKQLQDLIDSIGDILTGIPEPDLDRKAFSKLRNV